MFIGIDFGTSYTELTIYYKNGNDYSISTALLGSLGMPTLMKFDESIGWICGEECYDSPEDSIANVKKKLRQGADIFSTETSKNISITYKDLLIHFLSYAVKAGYDRFIELRPDLKKDPIEKVMITVPCGFSIDGITTAQYNENLRDVYNQVLRQAIRSARLQSITNDISIEIVEEPVAAAMAYYYYYKNRENLENGNLTILVLDIGGGTSDISIVKSNRFSSFAIPDNGKAGDLNLGGVNWDEALLDLVIEKIKREHPDYQYPVRNRTKDLIKITSCKERLSNYDTQKFVTEDHHKVEITKTEFINYTTPLRKKVKKLLSEIVEKNGGIDKIDRVVLVGGTCKMPQIKELVAEMYSSFPKTHIISFSTSYAIADGAAYMASLNLKDIFSDIATHTYGVECNLKNENSTIKIPGVYNMIFKGRKFIEGKIVETTGGFRSAGKKTFSSCIYESNCNKEECFCEMDPNFVPFKNNENRLNSKEISKRWKLPDGYTDDEIKIKLCLTKDGILKIDALYNGIILPECYEDE